MTRAEHRKPARRVRRLNRKRGGGFTLVEVVVAFAVLAITFSTLYEVLGSSLNRAGEVERRECAAMSAQSLLAESSVAATLREKSDAGKTANGMTWERQVELYDVGRSLQTEQQPFLVSITVRWGPRESQALHQQAILLGKAAIP